MDEVTHYIITRCFYPDHMNILKRADIMKKNVIASLRRQTNQNFIWVLIINKNHLGTENEVPHKAIYDFELPKNRLLIHDGIKIEGSDKLPNGIADSLFANCKTEWMLTTRLDNDDVIHPEFVQKVQDQVRQHGLKTYVIDWCGYRMDHWTRKTYGFGLYNKHTSSFASLLEPNLIPETVFKCGHLKLGDHYPIIKNGEKLFCQVVHGDNVHNHHFTAQKEVEVEWVV